MVVRWIWVAIEHEAYLRMPFCEYVGRITGGWQWCKIYYYLNHVQLNIMWSDEWFIVSGEINNRQFSSACRAVLKWRTSPLFSSSSSNEKKLLFEMKWECSFLFCEDFKFIFRFHLTIIYLYNVQPNMGSVLIISSLNFYNYIFTFYFTVWFYILNNYVSMVVYSLFYSHVFQKKNEKFQFVI